MSTTLHIPSVLAPSGTLLRLRLWSPSGSNCAELPLLESPPSSGQFVGDLLLDPSPPDSPTIPYEIEARQVASQSSASFDVSTIIRLSRGAFGYLRAGQWADTLTANPAAIYNVTDQ